MATKLKVTVCQESGSSATFALFRNLSSCKEIRQTVMSGSLECSLLKPQMIVNVFQVQVAAFKAIQLFNSKSMTTKNVHSEVLYCLSPSRNINESFKTFGVSDADASLLAVLVNDDNDERFDQLCQIVGIPPVSIEEVGELANEEAITQAYKLTKEELSVYPLLEAVVSRIAAKDIITAGKGKK